MLWLQVEVYSSEDKQLTRLASVAAECLKESSTPLGSKRARAIMYDHVIGRDPEQLQTTEGKRIIGSKNTKASKQISELITASIPMVEVKKKKNSKSTSLSASKRKKSTYKYISLAETVHNMQKEVNVYGVSVYI